MCSLALGVYYIQKDKFFGETEKLIGTIVYGTPVGRLAANSISDLLNRDEVWELTRLFIHDGFGKNIESHVISQSFKYIKKHHPNIKCLMSYADPEAGHVGTIYQATNWLYQIQPMIGPSYLFSFTNDPYEWVHPRTINSKYETADVHKLSDVCKKDFWYRIQMKKHRYLMFLTNKKEKRKLINSLKHPVIPYPKNINDTTGEIIHVKYLK